MPKFYRIQVSTIHLSQTGANAAPYAKARVLHVEDLLSTTTGASVPSADGTAVLQIVPWTKGKTFDIQVDVLTQDVWEDLRDLMITNLAADTSFTVIGTGITGNFSVSAKPFPQKPFAAERFSGSRVYNC